jgi:hypothetical protein
MFMNNEDKNTLWKNRFAEYDQSSMSGRQWCSTHNISYDMFRYWKEKLRPESIVRKPGSVTPKTQPAKSSEGTKWVESLFMPTSADTTAVNANAIKVTYGDMQIWLSRGFDKILLREIVEALS